MHSIFSVVLGDSEKEHGLSYVALSRATDINNVYISGRCSLDRLTTKISAGKKLQERLLEDERLNNLYQTTLDFFDFDSMK